MEQETTTGKWICRNVRQNKQKYVSEEFTEGYKMNIGGDGEEMKIS